jgi:circadian clock protein KaiB
MKARKAKRPARTRARTAAEAHPEQYLLRLYVAGTSSRSSQAILRARALCADELEGRYTLEVIDIYQDPIRARDAQIVATPTLVREFPRPLRRLIGSLARPSHLLAGLGLDTLAEPAP